MTLVLHLHRERISKCGITPAGCSRRLQEATVRRAQYLARVVPQCRCRLEVCYYYYYYYYVQFGVAIEIERAIKTTAKFT